MCSAPNAWLTTILLAPLAYSRKQTDVKLQSNLEWEPFLVGDDASEEPCWPASDLPSLAPQYRLIRLPMHDPEMQRRRPLVSKQG